MLAPADTWSTTDRYNLRWTRGRGNAQMTYLIAEHVISATRQTKAVQCVLTCVV